MKITFFSSMMPFAGMDNRVVSLANRFVDLGHDTSIFTFFLGRDDIDPRVKIDIYTPLNLEPNTFLFLSKYAVFRHFFSFPIAKQLKKVNPEILCVDYTPMDWYARKAKRKLHYKLVYTIHGLMDRSLCPKGSWYIQFKKQLHEVADSADLVVAVSNSVKMQLREEGIDSVVIPNGVDTDFFRPNKILPGLTKVDPIMLHVGRIMPHKGVHLLIDAFKEVKKEIPNVKLYILGSVDFDSNSTYVFQVFRQISDVKDSVFLLQNTMGGTRDETLLRLYCTADIFTCASLYEGFPLSFLEAQACAKPCVGFDTMGVSEAVINRETGILVEKGNVEKMAEALISLLTNNKVRKKMGKAARKHAEKYDWKIIADRASRIYEKIT